MRVTNFDPFGRGRAKIDWSTPFYFIV